MDTIAAIATAIGQSALGIIKISGSESFNIINKIFQGKKKINFSKIPSHTLHYGYIFNPDSLKKIDEVLISIMRGPNSYTCENVVEINGHGGKIPLYKILDLVLSQGARLAEPGEFTKRAFLNGRINLLQAEAVADLISTETEKSLSLLLDTIEGNSYKPVLSIFQEINSWYSLIEAELNFPENISYSYQPSSLLNNLDQWQKFISSLITSSNQYQLMIHGMQCVLLGRTNVGKSSLMNLLVGCERSIVTDIPGTTTDVITESFYLEGILIKLNDTAGITIPKNEIEKRGIQKTYQLLQKADLILLILDSSTPLSPDDLALLDLIKISPKPHLIIFNKYDLPQILLANDLSPIINSPKESIIHLSAATGFGLDKLKESIKGQINFDGSFTYCLNLRQKQLLSNIQGSLNNLKNLVISNQNEDLIVEEFKAMNKCFLQFQGQQISEDILDKIFSQFCIGK